MTRLTFHLILHTHWDREWYLPRAAFQARLVPTVGAALDLLERDGDARFLLDGQTIVAEDALDVQPDWITRVADAVTDGRLDVGPWYVLADELIPSGESMIRNLLQGSRDAAALGARMNVLYSPDAFGHPAILPSLAAGFGIDAAVVWRGLGRPTGTDRDLYRWRGRDGTDMLTYHLPGPGYEIGYDLIANPLERWPAIRHQLVARAGSSHVAVFVGADHHSPPADAGALRDAIAAIESGNFVRLSSLGEYFDAVRTEAAAVPSIEGELRWSYGHTWTLQGTHATRARLKRRYGAAELHLSRMVEPLAALAAWHNGLDLRGLLRTTWRTLIQCQFHDTICGCSADFVACEQDVRLTSVTAASVEIGRAALHDLTGHDADAVRDGGDKFPAALLVWNPVPRRRSAIVTAEITCFRRDILVGPPTGRAPRIGTGYRPFSLVSSEGRSIPVQVLSITPTHERCDAARHYPDQDDVDLVRIAFDLPEVKGLGCSTFTPGSSLAPVNTNLTVTESTIENSFLSITLTSKGVDLIDRRNGHRFVDMLALIDERDDGDTYTPWVDSRRASGTVAYGDPWVIAHGPFVAAIERPFAIGCGRRGHITGRMVLIVHADSPLLRVRIELDNHAIDHRLRLRLPVGVGATAKAGAPFGFEDREPVTSAAGAYPAESPICTAPAHRYVAAGNGNRGVALLCPAHFEYEWTVRRDIMLTLLRSVGQLSKGELPTRPGHAGWPMATPDAQEPGAHVIEFAIAPLLGSESNDAATLERMWEDAFLAPQSTFFRQFTGTVGGAESLGAELTGAGLVFSSIKPAEDGRGVVLRCYNAGSEPTTGSWTFRSMIGGASEVRADESIVASLDVREGRALHFSAPTGGIVSILVTPAAQ